MHTLVYPELCNSIPPKPVAAGTFTDVISPVVEFPDHLAKAMSQAEIRYFLLYM